MTKEKEIDDTIEELKKAMKANAKAKQDLVNCELEVRQTHFASVKANERLRNLLLDTYE